MNKQAIQIYNWWVGRHGHNVQTMIDAYWDRLMMDVESTSWQSDDLFSIIQTLCELRDNNADIPAVS